MNQSIDEIATSLKAAQRILVVSHTNPDPDALGSSAGLALALRSIGKDVVIINESIVPEGLAFIPGTEHIVNTVPKEKFDLYCILDCGERKRVGDSLVSWAATVHPLLNIDHHISNDFFADQNYVIPEASSTSELVYLILREAGIRLDSQSASALLAGVMGDTGSFRYANASAQVFAIAADLVSIGARPDVIAKNLYGQLTRAAVSIAARALSEIKFIASGRCAWIVVDSEMMAQLGATREDTEGLVERGRDIKGVDVSIFISEDEGVWKVSMRSTDARFNVSQIASQFGGGGHVMAAAFRWKRSYQELERELQSALLKLF